MKFGIFGKEPLKEDIPLIQHLMNTILFKDNELLVWDVFFEWVKEGFNQKDKVRLFHTPKQLDIDADVLLSLGGDGTMLDTMEYVLKGDTAVLGINLGHLGFLTAAGRREMGILVDELQKKHYKKEKRQIIEVYAKDNPDNVRRGVNEVCIASSSHSTIIDTEVFVNRHYLATYSGDGILVATPTGSTAYSLSCGGPIIAPDSHCLCITPIAPHNLTLRPIVISDSSTVKVHMFGGQNAGVSVDSYDFDTGGCLDIIIKKSSFTWNLVRLERQNFFMALRDKLMWGTNIKKLQNER